MTAPTVVLAAATLALTACAGGQSDQAATPTSIPSPWRLVNVSAMYDVGPGLGLGSVPPGGEAAFAFYWRAGELRMVVDYLERKSTSNGLVYVDQGDVLELVITNREPQLRKRP